MKVYYVRNLTSETITLRDNYQVILSLQPAGQSDDREAVSMLAMSRQDFQSYWGAGFLAVYADPAYQVVISRPSSGELTDALSDGDIDERILTVGNATYATPAAVAGTYAKRQSALAPIVPRQRLTKPTLWSALQSGHGWTQGGTGITWNLNDATDHYAGTQCVSFVTAGTGGLAWVQQLNSTARDLTNMDITIWVKIDSGLENLNRIQVVLSSDNVVNYYQGNSVYDGTWPTAPVRQMRQGEWFPLTFNFEMLTTITGSPVKTAITGMRITLQDKNTGGTVAGKIGLVEYRPRRTTFPNGVVSLTFDDSLLTTYTNALPILAQRRLAATEYAIADLSDAGGASMATAKLFELEDQFGWEIAAHAYTIANHNAGFNTLSESVLDAEMANLKAWGLGNGFRAFDHLAYPLGYHTALTDKVARRYFATARTLYSRPQESLNPSVPLRIRSLGVGATTTVGAIQTEIDRCTAHGTWLILTIHGVVPGTPTSNEISNATLASIADYLLTKSCEVLPVGDVWRAMS